MQNESLYNENDLLRQVAEGNQLAFRRLFDRYNKRLFTFAEEMLKSAADAEEIVQECFTKLWVDRANFGEIDHAGNYLYRMVRNKTLDHIRKVAREQKLISQVWANISKTDEGLQEEIQKKETQELIEQALSALSAQKQHIYRLSRESDYSHEQIADLTGLSKSRINNILVETLKHIKTHLEGHSGTLATIFWLYSWDRLL